MDSTQKNGKRMFDSYSSNTIGLRRVDPKWMLPNGVNENNAFVESDTFAIYYGGSSLMSSAFALENQKQQLFSVCEIIQSNVSEIIEQIMRIIHCMMSQQEGNGDSNMKFIKLLSDYKLKIWPMLIDVDFQIGQLSKAIREKIDSCNVNEHRLNWLLSINKFQMKIKKMVDVLIFEVGSDIERVLEIHMRCNVCGIGIKKETIEAIKEMRKEICSN